MAAQQRPHVADYAGRTLGHHEILELIERTQLSVTYKAVDDKAQRIVHVTLLHTDQPLSAERRQRFRQECSLVARLNQPHIQRLLGWRDDEAFPLLVFAELDGQVLTERLGKPWPYEVALPLVDELASALDAAHRVGVIHWAFGPDRVTMRADESPVITGFAVPRLLGIEGQVGRDGLPLAPVEYLSPEQIRGQPADARSDVYALACLTYALLSGDPPFRGSTEAVAKAHQQSSPRDLRAANPSVPLWVSEAILKALAKDPHDRFQSIHQFADALRRNEAMATPANQASGETQVAPAWLPPIQRLDGGRRRPPMLPAVLMLGAVVVLAFAVTALLLRDGDDNEESPLAAAGEEDSEVAATPTAQPTVATSPSATPTTAAVDTLAVGDTATVQGTTDGLRVRAQPAGEQVATLANGTVVTITAGPTNVALGAGQPELVWWQVQYDGGNGWVAEGDEDERWLANLLD
ncbi:MAG: protein kinase [Dehalococcoidia bacterium]|nr:protein kinase [Dehalococcoidia bacterium]